MKTCAHCGTSKWGLIRYWFFQLVFCSKRCRDTFFKERRNRMKALFHE